MTKTINLLLNINWLSHNYCLWLALGWGLPCPSGRITNHWPHTVMTQQGLQSRNGAIFHPYWRKGKLISTTKKKYTGLDQSIKIDEFVDTKTSRKKQKNIKEAKPRGTFKRCLPTKCSSNLIGILHVFWLKILTGSCV